MSPGARGRSSCGSGTSEGGRRGGAAPPLRLPPGAQPRSPVSGHPRRRAGGGRCSGCCAGARSRTHSPGARTPAPLQLGRAWARAAVSGALQRRRRRPREGGGRGRGRDESPRGEGAAAQPLPQRPGSHPLHRPLPVAQGPRLRAWGARSGCPTPPDSGEPQCWSLGEVTLRVKRGFGERFAGRASDFKLWRSSPWDLEGNLAGTSK